MRSAPDEEVPDKPPPDDRDLSGLVGLAVLAAVGGIITGLLGGSFRWVLVQATGAWQDFLHWARDLGGARLLLPILAAALAAALARLLVRWAPEAAGSGVQRVEAMVRHQGMPARLRVIPAKFIGGTLAIGVGMALGREGPTVQMGSTVGGMLSRRANLSAHDERTMRSALAGAGLGVAFSAPVGGAIFVLEELARAIRTRLLVAVMISSGVALSVAYLIIGRTPVLQAPAVDYGPTWTLLIVAPFGVLVGLLGIYYNRLVLWNLDFVDRFRTIPPEGKAAIIGAIVGLVGVIAPLLVGGGESQSRDVLSLSYPVGTLLLVLVVRWFIGPLSYSAGTPGGLFAPMLLLGAVIGATYASVLNTWIPGLELSVESFAIVGMSTFFTAVVRAPITGIVLCVEMTGTTAVMVPMLVAAGMAVVVCSMLKAPPIYDTLRERLPNTVV